MRILFIAKHESRGNEDERAISHSLKRLGHEVVEMHEGVAPNRAHKIQADFCLTLKFQDLETLQKIKIPKFAWYFDKVEFGTGRRPEYIKELLNIVDGLFLTDGEYVKKLNLPNVFCLRQGVDERHAYYLPLAYPFLSSVGFVGEVYNDERGAFVKFLMQNLGDGFFEIYRMIYKSKLSSLFCRVPVIVSPDSPNNDDYWSNRVYITLGHGGFLIHPYCAELAKEFVEDKEIVFYRSRDELLNKIKHHLNNPKQREVIRANGYKKCFNEYSYTRRCHDLVNTIQKLIGKQEQKPE